MDWFRIEVKDITSEIITLEILTQYLDGTNETDTVDARELGFIVDADLNEGDSIITPLIEGESFINGTVSREYAGVSRTINYIELSATEVLTLTYKVYFDKTTGIMCELSLSLTMDLDEEYYEANVTYKLNETNLFKSIPLTEQWWFYLIIGIVVVAIIIVVIIIQRR